MLDLIYVAITVAFFALMLGYVRACSVLGSAATATMDQDGSRSEGKQS